MDRSHRCSRGSRKRIGSQKTWKNLVSLSFDPHFITLTGKILKECWRIVSLVLPYRIHQGWLNLPDDRRNQLRMLKHPVSGEWFIVVFPGCEIWYIGKMIDEKQHAPKAYALNLVCDSLNVKSCMAEVWPSTKFWHKDGSKSINTKFYNIRVWHGSQQRGGLHKRKRKVWTISTYLENRKA